MRPLREPGYSKVPLILSTLRRDGGSAHSVTILPSTSSIPSHRRRGQSLRTSPPPLPSTRRPVPINIQEHFGAIRNARNLGSGGYASTVFLSAFCLRDGSIRPFPSPLHGTTRVDVADMRGERKRLRSQQREADGAARQADDEEHKLAAACSLHCSRMGVWRVQAVLTRPAHRPGAGQNELSRPNSTVPISRSPSKSKGGMDFGGGG